MARTKAQLRRLPRGKVLKTAGRKLNRRQKKEVKAIVSKSVETKYKDQDWAPVTAGTYAQLDRSFTNFNGVALSHMAQGAGIQNRVGDRIKPKMLEIRAQIYYNVSAVTANSQHAYRILIVKWLDDDLAVAPSIASVLQNVSGGASDYSPITSPYNWQGRKQKLFQVVADIRGSIAAYSRGATITRKIRLRGNIDFGTGLQTGEGHYFLFACADDVTGAHSPDIQMIGYSRMTFTDD